MKNRFTFISLFLVFIMYANAQKWEATGALAATGSPYYLIAATSVGDNVFVVNANQAFGLSTDLGKTWKVPSIAKPNGAFAALTGVKDRLYASMKINTFDFELRYSKDNGTTWQMDTVGLPKNALKTGKSAVNLTYMGNDYVLAHNYTEAVYKKVDETKWKPTKIDYTIAEVAATKDKWLAIGQEKILQSTNNGGTWTPISTTGLPAKFQGSKISTNGTRIYVSNAPKDGAQDVYYSDDGGLSWTLTNSAGKFTHANPWVQNLYAVEDYVFAAIIPISFTKPPPYIYSKTKQPDFMVGDFSVFKGLTNTNLPFFFHVKNKLFTMFGDLYSSEPGFKGESNPTTGIEFAEIENNSITVYPNPASQTIQIKAGNNEISKIEIISLTGKVVFQQSTQTRDVIDVSNWGSGVYVVKTTLTDGQDYQSKFIKN